jgi:hypothetical protein
MGKLGVSTRSGIVGIVFRGIYTASYLRPWARVAYLILLRNFESFKASTRLPPIFALLGYCSG